ncbi:MAG: hypothetical protein WA045_04525, partial [Nitrospira sp.]
MLILSQGKIFENTLEVGQPTLKRGTNLRQDVFNLHYLRLFVAEPRSRHARKARGAVRRGFLAWE